MPTFYTGEIRSLCTQKLYGSHRGRRADPTHGFGRRGLVGSEDMNCPQRSRPRELTLAWTVGMLSITLTKVET